MVANVMTAQDKQNGFSVQFRAAEARRQLRMSFGVVVVLAAAIVSAAATFGGHPISAHRDVVSSLPITTIHAETDAVGARAI